MPNKELKKLQKDAKPLEKSVGNNKAFRDNIRRVTSEAIKRVAYKAGVPSLTQLCFEETRGVIMMFLHAIIKNAIIVARSADKAIVREGDVKYALDQVNFHVIAEVDGMKKCEVFVPKTTNKKRERGEGAIERIRYYQKQSDCFLIETSVIADLVKEISRDHDNVSWSSRGLGLLQAALEHHLHELFEDAVLCMVHAGRKTMLPKDIRLAQRISGKSKQFSW